MGKKETFRWMDEDEISDFMKALIMKLCKKAYHPEAIGKYLALAIEGLDEAGKERELP